MQMLKYIYRIVFNFRKNHPLTNTTSPLTGSNDNPLILTPIRNKVCIRSPPLILTGLGDTRKLLVT